MFISSAYAADAAPAGGDMSMIVVLTICMVAVYFFVMRPNSKKRKEMQKLLDNLAVGDEVLTNGGIAGRISKLPENKEYVLITVSGGIELQMKRNYVVAVLPKGTLVDSIKGTAETSGRKLVKRKKVKAQPAAAAQAPEAEKPAEAATAPEAAPEKTETETPAPAAEAAPAEVKAEEAPAAAEAEKAAETDKK